MLYHLRLIWTCGEIKISIAEQSASANFSFYMGTSNTNIDEIKAIDPKEVCGIKIFMGSSTGQPSC